MLSSQFPILLAWTFLGSFLLGLLKTSRWTAMLISVIAVWCARLEQSDIDLVLGGTIEGYAWFGMMSAAAWIPTAVVALIAADIGSVLQDLLASRMGAESEAPSDEAPE